MMMTVVPGFDSEYHKKIILLTQMRSEGRAVYFRHLLNLPQTVLKVSRRLQQSKRSEIPEEIQTCVPMTGK